MRVCDIEFVVFTVCESCTRPISTNPASMEAGEYGLTRGTCFFARRLEVVAFAGLLRLSWCAPGGVDFFVLFFVSTFFFFERTRPTASTRQPLASFTSLLVMRQGRGSEATEAVFCLYAKKPLHTGVRTGCHYFISLSVCLSVCV